MTEQEFFAGFRDFWVYTLEQLPNAFHVGEAMVLVFGLIGLGVWLSLALLRLIDRL